MDSVTERLRCLTIGQYSDGQNSEREMLKDLTNDIEKLSPMAHPQLRTDFSKRMFLENAVKDRQWALIVSANHELMGLSYVQYRTYLEKFESKWGMFSSATAPNPMKVPTAPQFRSARWKSVNYAGPSKYGRSIPKHRFSDSGSQKRTLRCFNCGEEHCRVKTCTKKMDMKRIADNFAKFRQTRNDTHFTEAFFALAEVLVTAGKEGELTVMTDSDPETVP